MLADYHMHCLPWSPDAQASMAELFQGAYERGMTHVCLTSHMENCVQDPSFEGQFPPFREWDQLFAGFEAARREFAGKMDVRLGAEIGSPHYLPEEGARLYGRQGLDFVIGSIHNLRHAPDFYFYRYTSFEAVRPDVEAYLDEYITLAGAGLCDVLGHIGYMQRYMARQGVRFDIMLFEDRLRAIFRRCIDHGVGIEVNTSGLRDTLRDFIPQPSALRLYRDMGGELVTAGSDAHSAAGAGVGIREAYELLRTVGFKYVCLYKGHEPEFVRL